MMISNGILSALLLPSSLVAFCPLYRPTKEASTTSLSYKQDHDSEDDLKWAEVFGISLQGTIATNEPQQVVEYGDLATQLRQRVASWNSRGYHPDLQIDLKQETIQESRNGPYKGDHAYKYQKKATDTDPFIVESLLTHDDPPIDERLSYLFDPEALPIL